jgi:hypothetical protein
MLEGDNVIQLLEKKKKGRKVITDTLTVGRKEGDNVIQLLGMNWRGGGIWDLGGNGGGGKKNLNFGPKTST